MFCDLASNNPKSAIKLLSCQNTWVTLISFFRESFKHVCKVFYLTAFTVYKWTSQYAQTKNLLMNTGYFYDLEYQLGFLYKECKSEIQNTKVSREII